MLMVEGYLLGLFGNSVSGRRGGSCGRRRGGVVAPMTMRRSTVGFVSDRPAAASATVVFKCLNLSNPGKIQAVGLAGLRVSCSLPIEA
jgi:hypothetical protein